MLISRDVAGAACVLGAALLFVISHRSAVRGRAVMLAALVGGALLLRLFAASDLFLHDWDERYHALVAKHLAEHPLVPTLIEDPVLPYDFRAWTANHVWLHKQPLALWLMALSLKLFGLHEIALRLPSVLLGSLAVAMTWWIGKELGGDRVGWVAALLHAMNGLLLELSAGRIPTDHVDSVFVVLVEAGVLAAVLGRRRGIGWDALTGALVGAAALAKSPAALIVVAVWGALRWGRERPLRIAGGALLALAVASAVYLPWQLHVRSAFPEEAAWEAAYDLRHLGEALEGHDGGPLYHWARIPRHFGELSLISLGWFLAARLFRRRGSAALAVWFLVPYAFFSLVATKMPAYVLVSAPALFVIVAMHWCALRERLGGLGRWPRMGATVLLALLLALPARFGLERMKPVGGPPWRAESAESFKEFAREIGDEKVVVFGVDRPIELMFYSAVIAYERTPDEADVAACEARGYRVVIWGE